MLHFYSFFSRVCSNIFIRHQHASRARIFLWLDVVCVLLYASSSPTLGEISGLELKIPDPPLCLKLKHPSFPLWILLLLKFRLQR
ncbi:hypothetical protein BDQ12DRAFT_527338 [Crucibulum laeve]|uniref:Uncharacterized protein n=1 Tax=Crucibulum laeve TaxID=68775 RepID=A0A5C3LHK7_9AGAR|nr:hypothetical protein BDQ12DRAFT_527338 [Crucibulum laeve]